MFESLYRVSGELPGHSRYPFFRTEYWPEFHGRESWRAIARALAQRAGSYADYVNANVFLCWRCKANFVHVREFSNVCVLCHRLYD